jgi:iron complex outermembrane receptor protein
MITARHLVGHGLALTLALGLGFPPATFGQAVKSKKPGGGAVEIEEITVTAQKREESIQEIPISVTAVTSDVLRQRGAVSLSDLTESVPGLQAVVGSSGSSSMEIGMRGTSNGDPSMSQNPTVGLYVDGFYIAKIQGANLDLEDLDRVEVLRGPQGTLYGKNTVGGAVNFVTKKPSEERSITASTEVGNYDAFRGRVTVNVPLIGRNGFFQSDSVGTLSLRENAVYRSHEPYVDNRSPTNVPASGAAGLNNLNRVLNMTSLRWQPTKDLTVDYSFEYHRFRQSGTAAQVSHIYPGSPVSAGPFDLTPYLQPDRVDSMANNDVISPDGRHHRLKDDGNNRMHILTAAWDLGRVPWLGNVTLKSISGYRSMSVAGDTDLDGSPLHVADFTLTENLETWSEELQVIGTAPRVHYVLGAYAYGDHTTEISNENLFAGADQFYYINTGKTSSYAPFGQVTYTPPVFSDKLSITAGLRYTQEHVSTHRNFRCLNVTAEVAPGVYRDVCNLGIPGLNNFNLSVAKSFGAHGTALPGLSPMGDVSYQWTDNTMTYFRISRGFQSGTVNGRATYPELFKTVEPEKLWAYEGGVKSQWLDKRLRLNLDGFLSEYTDQQVTVFRSSPTSGAVSSLENAGASEFWGFELEMVALPLREVEAILNYSYINTKYLKYQEQKFTAQGQPVFGPNGEPIYQNAANLNQVPLAPDHTITVGLTYTAPPTSVGVFSAHVDGYWQDSMVTHSAPPQYDACPSYVVFNGRLQFMDIPLQKGSLDIALYSRNLFNRQYRVFGIDLGGLGYTVDNYGDPRTFGVQLTYNFNASGV